MQVNPRVVKEPSMQKWCGPEDVLNDVRAQMAAAAAAEAAEAAEAGGDAGSEGGDSTPFRQAQAQARTSEEDKDTTRRYVGFAHLIFHRRVLPFVCAVGS